MTTGPAAGPTVAFGRLPDHLWRELVPQVVGAVVRRYGDFAAAEDAVQEALIAAAAQWPETGIPSEPRGWLVHVASRRMTDHQRAESARRRRHNVVAALLPDDELVVPPPDEAPEPERDDTLTLLSLCCHPSLTSTSAIALTLRAVGGLTTAEIANAFLVPEATMAQRISRAKQTIKKAGGTFGNADDAASLAAPGAHEGPNRLSAVMHVLYLIFNEGYTTSSGPELVRADLAIEAIRLARLVHAMRPHDPEVAGLLALMLLTDARRAARTGPGGELIPLAEQDRGRWDRAAITEGVALVTGALARGRVGPYQIQAAIAALHDEAGQAEATDWPQILALYELLRQMSDNPMVALSHTIAAAMVHGAKYGLEKLATLATDPRLADHHRLYATRAHFHEMAGDPSRAGEDYRAAAERTTSLPERNYLLLKITRLSRA